MCLRNPREQTIRSKELTTSSMTMMISKELQWRMRAQIEKRLVLSPKTGQLSSLKKLQLQVTQLLKDPILTKLSKKTFIRLSPTSWTSVVLTSQEPNSLKPRLCSANLWVDMVQLRRTRSSNSMMHIVSATYSSSEKHFSQNMLSLWDCQKLSGEEPLHKFKCY